MMKVLAYVLVFIGVAYAKPGSRVIKTRYGDVRGKIVEFDGNTMEAYYGIPFAKPPLGVLRFKHPVPVDPWENILEADKEPNACIQKDLVLFKMIVDSSRIVPTTDASEDCLYLNIYVPRDIKNGSDVLVSIPGGGFSTGSNSAPLYDPFVLAMEENLIVVSFNYRIASIGFLHLDHLDFEPNRGLMDQLLALKWVAENIAAFGGDPNKVTIMGVSAGGMSVGFHILSPLSTGLFHRAIMDSGVPVSNVVIHSKSVARKNTLKLALNLNCSNLEDNNSLAKCFQEADAMNMVNKEPAINMYFFAFWPIVDGQFILEHPIKTMMKGKLKSKVDILLGYTRSEGSIFLSSILPRVFIPFTDRIYAKNTELLQMVDKMLQYEPDIIKTLIKKRFLENINETEDVMKNGEAIFREVIFTCPINNFGNWLASMGTEVYSYFFDYRSPDCQLAKWLGVIHGETVRYAVGDVLRQGYRSQKDIKFSRRLMRYWANFVKTGNPNVRGPDINSDWITWPRFTVENRTSLILAPRVRELRYAMQDDQICQFWDMIYEIRRLSSVTI